ncbi:hypothetical protein BGV50_28480 [Burkholderia ubonensis]|nr:hypothetical protein BGV50_28480 [Burkholderia ubonensis]
MAKPIADSPLPRIDFFALFLFTGCLRDNVRIKLLIEVPAFALFEAIDGFRPKLISIPFQCLKIKFAALNTPEASIFFITQITGTIFFGVDCSPDNACAGYFRVEFFMRKPVFVGTGCQERFQRSHFA